ncbi:MAG: hypothetical protein ACHQ1H_06460 [Nitrososphaerales archaeon]|jgi:uncharacterized membrane protein YfcA
MAYPRKNEKFSQSWALSVLASLGLFVGAVLSAEIPSYGIYLSLALVILGGFMMLISGIHREQARKKETVVEALQLEPDF